MPWSEDQQTQYSDRLQELVTEYSDAYTTWTNTIQDSARDPSLAPEADKAAAQVNSVLQNLRLFVKDLQATSSAALAQDDFLQKIRGLATQIAEEKTELAKLRSESITRDEQSQSLNPRAKPSPYINILGLHRTFRDSTRFAILMTSILFGVLACVCLAYLVVSLVSVSTAVNPGSTQPVAVGGSRVRHK